MTPHVDTPREPQVHVWTPLSDLVFEHQEWSDALPNLAAALGAIPGGLGAEAVDSFRFAGQDWTPVDADPSGTPIGMQLAMEQRGLRVRDAGHHGGDYHGGDYRGADHHGADHQGAGYPGAGYNGAGPGRRRAGV